MLYRSKIERVQWPEISPATWYRPACTHAAAQALRKSPTGSAGAMEDELGDPHDAVAVLDLACVPPALEDRTEIALDRDRAASAVLRMLGPQPDHPAVAVDVRPAQRHELPVTGRGLCAGTVNLSEIRGVCGPLLSSKSPSQAPE